ncbi:MAG: GNAT family N-acetyltransferase [Planctomyces sp.]|nr:GNAT family N-acetyltransferase [Planctomyces sp.]
MTSLIVRRAESADAEILTEFNCRLALETENKALNRETVLSGVRRGLSVGDEVQYWVAEHEEPDGWKIVGQLMLTREWSDWRNGWMVWLQSVYVHENYRRSGVFRTLFERVAQHVRSQAENVAFRLYVEHENEHAISTYTRLGFGNAGYLVMEMPIL